MSTWFFYIHSCPKNCWHSSCASSFYPIKKFFFPVKSRSLSTVFQLTFSEKVRCPFPPDIDLIDMIDSLLCPCHDTFTWCTKRFICETGSCRSWSRGFDVHFLICVRNKYLFFFSDLHFITSLHINLIDILITSDAVSVAYCVCVGAAQCLGHVSVLRTLR